eukprot:gene4956-22207_t
MPGEPLSVVQQALGDWWDILTDSAKETYYRRAQEARRAA